MILVAGAGPGGLAAGLALHRAGFPVQVWERADALRVAGAGLTLQINAMRMLDALGVAEALQARGARLEVGRVSDEHGRTLHAMPFGHFAERFGQPGIGIHRGALSEVLAAALPEGAIVFGRAVADVQQDDTGVEVRDESGASHRFEAVIGADGIHSTVRTAVFGETTLRYAGYTCWRGIADRTAPKGPSHMEERWGPGRRFGTVPIGENTTYWFATETAPPDGHDGSDPKAELLERFADFPAEVNETLEATPVEAILRNDIIDFPPLPTWTKDRVTLLGDAAHAMTPNLGQGACQAIEDAVVLGVSVREHGLPDGLTHYEAIRRPRATKFVVDSYRFGGMAQARNGAVRWLRNGLVRMLASDRAIHRQLEPIYGVDVPAL